MSLRWTMASIVAAFVTALVFYAQLAHLLSQVFAVLEPLVARPTFTRTARAVFDGSLWLYQLVREFLTNPAHLLVALAVSLVLMGFSLAYYQARR
jgi:hypothetical protein